MSEQLTKQGPLRKAAEVQLGKDSATPVSPSEELLHELQVHQIELEMQNEALRETQCALEESRDRYVDLYEFAPVGYLTLTNTGEIAQANLTAATLLGVERKQLLKRRLEHFVSASDHDRWYRLFINAMASDERRTIALDLKRSDGTLFPVQLNCLRSALGNAEPTLRITLNDITERKQMEGALLDNEELYRLVFEMCEHAIFLTQPEEGIFLTANPAACSMFGYSQKEICDLGRAGIMDVTDTRWSSLLAERGHSGHVRSKVRCIRRNGEVFLVEFISIMFHDSKGRLRAAVHIRDISEQERAEKELRESEMRWQFAVESSGGAMWDWDVENDELFLTAAAKELFNLPETDSRRLLADLIGQVLEEDQALVQGQIDAIIAGKTSEWMVECRLPCLGGTPRWIAIGGRVMTRTSNGQPHRLVCISRDITQRKHNVSEARQQRVLVTHQAHLVLLGELASVLAHEINQPLTAITGFAAACARKTAENPEALELVRAIEEQAMRAGNIAWRMRGFARRQRLGRSALSLREVVAGVAKWISMDSAHLAVVIDITGLDTSLPQVYAERVELEQVLVNLVRNGIEAALPNATEQRIVIDGRLAEQSGQIEVSVTDWGCGLPSNIAFDVFQPFTSSKEQGLGLGLTICFSIIEGHGGHLWATPNPAGGTIFHFTLPVAEPTMLAQGEERP